MLNIGKMAPGSEDYYLSRVADGTEEYYLRRGEAPGRWIGRGLDPVGLEGGAKVEADELRAVLRGEDPGSGVRLASHPARKIPGFDLTFRAPKSVSIAWALGDQDTAKQVQAAHDAAVAAAVGYLERHALRTRRGAGGVERVEVDGLIGAAFGHRTSRAGDPLLHTHVLAANLVRASDDGVWRTFESRRMYQHAKTAGYLYQAQLRHELTQRLGVQWGPVTNGYADIAGIDRQLIDEFSQRRQAILERLAERGESSARAAQVATLTTREAKGEQPTERELREVWTTRAEALGFDRSALERLLGRHTAEAPDVQGLAGELIGDEALTDKAATFTRRDLLRAVAERLPDGATVEQVEVLAEAVLAAGRDQVVTLGTTRGRLSAVDVIRTADGRTIAGGTDDEVRMTTRGLLLAEQHAINTSIARQDEGVATVTPRTVGKVMAVRPTLTGEQIDMLVRLARDGDGVAVVVGKAGTGKTFALDAARHAWQASGIDVHGAALAARAARELQDSSGIPSTTIHKLLYDIDDPRYGSPLVPGSVLVVDEAGMVGTRQLARLLDHCEGQRVKVVLVGDPHQLPEIDAGGLFSTLAARLDAIELTDNRRQVEPWEIDALDRLRHGDPADALDVYDEHGRLITGDTAEGLREQLVSDWWHARHDVGADQAVMIALRQTDVDDLNQRARLRADAAGHLTGPTLTTEDGRAFRAGDRILCLRNDRRLGVVNGTFATITDLTGDGGLWAADDRGTVLQLPDAYVQAGHVAHGYAITGHKAQGLTVDHAFVLGSDLLYREWGYVAMSRGRHTNRLYVHPANGDPHGIHHQQQPDPDPHTRTVAGLRRSAAQTPAVAFLPDSYDVEQVRRTAARFLQLDRQITRTADTRRQLERTIQEASTAYEATVAAIHEADARRQELSGIRQFRRAVRDELEQLHNEIDDGRTLLHELHGQRTRAQRQVAQLPDDAQVGAWQTERADLARQLPQVVEQRATAALRQPPDYLTATIGTPPPSGPQREAWAAAARLVEEYRTIYDIRDPNSPLGQPRPRDPQQRADRNQALDALLEITRQQRTHDTGRQVDRDPPARGLGRGISR